MSETPVKTSLERRIRDRVLLSVLLPPIRLVNRGVRRVSAEPNYREIVGPSVKPHPIRKVTSRQQASVRDPQRYSRN